MSTVTKGLAQRQDLDNYDGTLAASRIDSTGGTTTGLKIGNHVDILQVYGGGNTSNMTHATLSKAVGALGSQNVTLEFAPGTWTFDTTIAIASNFTVYLPAGAILAPETGVTVTISGWLLREHDTYTGGDGTVTVSGNDSLQVLTATNEYAVDTGSADAYAIALSPAIAAYAAGQLFRFRATNTNTGASTLDVNSQGAKSIVQADGSTALSAGDITADQIVIVQYDSVGDEFHLVPTQQPPTDPAKLDADNVYTKTETWKKGTDVSSASDLNVTGDGNIFDVTGTTTIDTVQTKGIGTPIILEFDAATLLTHDATNLDLPGQIDITTGAGDVGIFYEYASADWRCAAHTRANTQPFSGSFLAGHIDGFATSNGTDTDHDIDIAAGTAVDSTGAVVMVSGSSFTKQIDVDWVEGTNQGGFPSGLTLTTSTWYHVFVIMKADGTVDGGFDTSLTATNLLADASDYTYYRRIGSVLTDGSSNIRQYFQHLDNFTWLSPIGDYSTTPVTTAAAVTLSVPTGIQVMAAIMVSQSTANSTYTGSITYYPVGADARSPGPTNAQLRCNSVNNTFNATGSNNFYILTDTSAQIMHDASNALGTEYISTEGWIDPRGRA